MSSDTHAKTSARPATSYDEMREMMQFISGDNNRASTSASALESIKLLAQLNKEYDDGKSDFGKSGLGKVFQYERQYLQAGIDAVTQNPALGDRFGRGLEGATLMASFMKQINMEEMAKDQIRGYLPRTGVSGSTDAKVSAFYTTKTAAARTLY